MASLRPIASATPVVWAPCPTCWGQRRIVCRPEGRGWELVTCYGCLGVGEVPQAARETGPPRVGTAPGSGVRRPSDLGA
jgi:hypothetical protein